MLNTECYAFSVAQLTEDTTHTLPTMPNILFPDFSTIQFPISVSPGTEADAATAGQFTVDNASKASWAIATILEAEERIAQRKALADEYKARLDAWLSSSNVQDNNTISYITFLLEPYARDEISKLHKSKTLSLPTGTASLRKLPDRLEITDNDIALAYCETEHPEAVIIKKELNKSILKDLILKQTEPIPGICAELGPDKLYIKPLKIGKIPDITQIAA